MACAIVSGHVAAFGLHLVPNLPVVEYHNRILDHYFLTAEPDEMATVDAGLAGPGWERTGRGFTAFGLNDLGQSCPGCVPVARFYGTPGLGPNSHFYTGHAEEADGLRRPGSGWGYEKDAFYAWLPEPDGRCAYDLQPVYRLYNNRWMFNDSNHRYVTSLAERFRMRDAGWIDEGTKFCVVRQVEVPLKSFDVVIPLESRILPSAVCEDESINLGPCMAINSLAPPTVPVRLDPFTSQAFGRLSGLLTGLVYADAVPAPVSDEFAAEHVFVMGTGDLIGIHVVTSDRPAGSYASVNPLYQFRTTPGPNGVDERFFPFLEAAGTELSIRFALKVTKVAVRDASSHAYGHPTVEFIDTRSGQHLYFTALAYWRNPGEDYLAPDVTTGKVIVGTTFRESTPYGRAETGSTLNTPPGFQGLAEGVFDFRMDSEAFGRVLASARSINPTLSADPSDYLVDNFHFNNEVVGNAEIGMSLGGFSLRLMPKN
jgi:hypothetical protein